MILGYNIHALNIQSIFTLVFAILIAAPLPIIFLSAPLGYIKDWFVRKSSQRIIRRHYGKPEFLSIDQLKAIFPKKSAKELEEIAYNMDARRTEYSYKY
jgi:hypothetical protein